MNVHYPNNGFKSYVNYVYDQYSIWPTEFFPFKVVQVLPMILWFTIKNARIELFFLAIFWVVIIKMSQGRDLIVSLFEPDGLYGVKRIVFNTLAVLSYSVSMWIIPAFIFERREQKTGKTKQPFYPFSSHLFFIHRILPLVPFWLLASALFRDRFWVFLVASLLELCLLYFFNHMVKAIKLRLVVIATILTILVVSTVYFFNYFQVLYTQMKVIFAINLYLISILMFFFYHYVDNRILKSHDDKSDINQPLLKKYYINSAAYIGIAVLHIIIVAIIYWLPFRMRIAPESMLLYMFSVYVFALDLLFYFINVSRRRQLISAFLAIGLALFLFSASWDINVSHHTMDANADSSFFKGSRSTFNDRYEELKQKILRTNTDSVPYPIILVSGEGGGSRAGMWFSQNLINFDYETQGKFRNYIFSLSTVSGSSVGLSTVYSFWDHTRNADSIPEKWLTLPSQVYANNYVGSSIRGLLITDLYKSIVPVNWVYDRNSTLQSEEAKTTEKAISTILGREDMPDSQITLKKDFMYFFYEQKDGKLKYRDNTPITLINTCRSNDGRRGIFSSIKLSNSYFNEAIDISGYLYEDSICSDKGERQCISIRKPISLVQACNTSELFPILSAPVYIDSLGSFVDGGYHENSGLKSTLDIYDQLINKLSKDPELVHKKYQIYILYLKNGAGEKQLYQRVKSEPTLLQPLTALFNQPFEGSESYFEEKARSVADSFNNVSFLEISLKASFIVDSKKSGIENKDVSKQGIEKDREKEILNDLIGDIIERPDGRIDTVLNFPLARWLSKTVIKRIQLKASPDNLDPSVTALLNQVRKLNRVQKVPEDIYKKMQLVAD